MQILHRKMQEKHEKLLKVAAKSCQIIDNQHFESSQKLRKDGIGIWKNFIGNMLLNYIYPMILVVNQYILLESSFEVMLSELKMSGK